MAEKAVVSMKLNRHTKQGARAFQIYKICGPGPFRVVDAEKALGKKRIGPIMGSLREDKICVHHDGSQMPVVRKKGEERTPPTWYFTPWAITKFEEWLKNEECDRVKA